MMLTQTARVSIIALGALALGAALPQTARAQWVVFDPTNFSENVLTEFNTLETTVNQATQISNELRQIALQIQNLQQLSPATLSALLRDYVTDSNQLQSTFTSINGLAANLATSSSRYNTLFPNRQITPGLTAAQVSTQSQAFLTQARSELPGVDQVTAQVAAQTTQQTGDFTTNVSALNAANGNVQALQAVGHIAAQIVTELAQTNALIMAMNQAQTTVSGQQVQDRDDAARRTLDVSAAAAPAAAAPVTYLP